MRYGVIGYIPQDRRRALATGSELPEHTHGAVLFADISGFTPLTEALDRALGARRGAEALTQQVNRVYEALIAQVDRYGGSVISFAGDSITCWFTENDERGTMNDEASHDGNGSAFIVHRSSLRALACALALQEAMRPFAAIALPDGTTTALALKVALASGPARRFVVGDPQVQLLDALAGSTLARMAAAEHLAAKGEVLIASPTAEALGDAIRASEWRVDAETGERFAVLAEMQISDFRLRKHLRKPNLQSAICNHQALAAARSV